MSSKRDKRVSRTRGLFSFLLTALGCSIPIGVLVWIMFTHDLHYNVYADSDVVWYREYFPTYFNVIVTALLSLFLGLIAAGGIWTTRYLKRPSDE